MENARGTSFLTEGQMKLNRTKRNEGFTETGKHSGSNFVPVI